MRFVRGRRLVLVLVLLQAVLSACAPAPESEDPVLQPWIDVSPGSPFSIEVNTQATVSAVVTGIESAIAFTSSNPAVATVGSTTGVVQALTLGTATITATAVANPAIQSSVFVTVVSPGSLPTIMSSAAMVGILINEVCPNEEEEMFATLLPIASDIRSIHEFHDCQRLVRNGAYESLVGIFAHRNIANLPNEVLYLNGRLGAVIINFKTKGDTMTYAPLGLAPGTNCLVLKWKPSHVSPGEWEAGIVHMPPTSTSPYGTCPDNLSWNDVPVSQRNLLDVKMQKNGVSPLGLPLAPPVARWDWDPKAKVNYIGIRCGFKDWCEIGASGFVQNPPLRMGPNNTLFKGYYDEQYLADQSGTLSDVWGTVRPGSDASVLGKIKRDNGWYKGATFDLSSPGAGSPAYHFYRTRLFLSPVTQTGKVRGTGLMEISSPPGNKDWYVRVNGNSVAGGVMKHRSHTMDGLNRFATVRWRWNADDETVWSYCPEDGCCELGRLQ